MKLSHNITKFYKKHHKIMQNLQKQRPQHNTKFTLITHKIHLRPPQKIIVPGPVIHHSKKAAGLPRTVNNNIMHHIGFYNLTYLTIII